jgi:hypothetical protein
MSEFCNRCGQGVLVQIQKNSGYCTPDCEEADSGRE